MPNKTIVDIQMVWIIMIEDSVDGCGVPTFGKVADSEVVAVDWITTQNKNRGYKGGEDKRSVHSISSRRTFGTYTMYPTALLDNRTIQLMDEASEELAKTRSEISTLTARATMLADLVK